MINLDDICFDHADDQQTLSSVPIPRLAAQAQKLARMGEISGESALALIVWPNQEDMVSFVDSKTWLEPEIEEEPSDLERSIMDVDIGLPSNVRIYHSYLVPLPGMCHAYVKCGYRMEDTVRCSRRASVGDYCRTHAKIVEQIDELAA